MTTLPMLGSSPHTRDKWHSPINNANFTGIIPAYAGQILYFIFIDFSIEDHPRIRGTNELIILILFKESGSSPHTRDKYPIS